MKNKRYELGGLTMKALIDLHCHTVASGHAYSTLKENIDEAKEKI
ncbi:PHP domain protein [[Clostridium] sordellii ATCC 9714]|nr:PHP domain protein [[Clostridium] sordellii ATCC 9714] [Paeniclostridium sordellii ATCC 9714]